jgi:hypothetical protein
VDDATMARVIDLMQQREELGAQLALKERDHAELVAAILKKIAEVSKVLDEYKAMVDTKESLTTDGGT